MSCLKKQIQKKVKASKRPKKRYVLFSVGKETRFDFFSANRFLENSFRRVFGSKFDEKLIKLVVFEKEYGMAILRCRREFLDEVKTVVDSSKPFKVVLVSGSIKKLKILAQKLRKP